MKSFQKLFLLLIVFSFAPISHVYAQFGVIDISVLGAANAAREQSEDDNKTIMWYDNANKMTIRTVGSVKNMKNETDMYEFYRINSNYKMIKEFTYQGKRAFLLFRNLDLKGNQIKSVELYLLADKQKSSSSIDCTKISKLIYHDLGKANEFCSVVTKAYQPKLFGKESPYLYSQIRLDDDTANFLISFMVDDKFYKNKTDIIYETTSSPLLKEPYTLSY